ncbi:tumor necrosis factor receptor superfamily member 16-like isoform X2 [Xenia sp. Carnegie-2017]|nr:tumor necrosis factor receptor superfamily member 16-like isoform X2 [Xenia sp. Carnegie-2017]XP_046852197.1 tumor necrosis factor receptor superfamily member 16-like isoform X2 [Xenia sp. Carnegie-2017]XP_046852198.1 tumor necrosis factor receptor superfamily member 16-like isoform X2 [Xenia sp. Carnegie-2017]XP_046852199.1 tumor necrosis factor receptor superfamily member 16-like isoform X2 [Xenia sp. Carnegie-2017]XP_046852200.1 tumor necrosis factor receptor superfamily member 16-like is
MTNTKRIIINLVVILCGIGFATACGKLEYLHDNRCCEMCKPGQYVSQHCTDKQRTKCNTCQFGKTTKTYNNATDCNCGKNKYFSNSYTFCMECSACTEGFFPIEKCGLEENTRCLKCPENHFSNLTKNFNSPCVPCTKCQHYVRECKPENDSICKDEVTQRQTTLSPTTISTQNTNKLLLYVPENATARTMVSNDSNNAVILLAVLGVLCFLLLALLVFIVMKARQKKRGGVWLTKHQSSEFVPLSTGILLRSQPASFLLKLKDMLTAEGRPNWRQLAGELQFTYDQICNLAVNKETAAENMLWTWQTSNEATMDRLYEALYTIKREDIASFVQEYALEGVASV